MKALILYLGFFSIGAAVSVFIGYYVERQTSPTLSLFVFLAMFFANYVVAWIVTILVMDGSLNDGQGRVGQRAAEVAGDAYLAASRRQRDLS